MPGLIPEPLELRKMHRFYVDSAGWNDSEVILSPASEHHLIDVLRVAGGEMVMLFDGRGRCASARVSFEKGHRALLKISEVFYSPEYKPSISLFQALPKGTRMDFIVEKATELGVRAVYPVVTERVVVRLNDEEKKEERRGRWQRIAISAAEQSGVNWVPEIKPVMDIGRIVQTGKEYDVFLVGALTRDVKPLREVMAEVRRMQPAKVALLIGPEGDLAPLELKLATDAGAVPVSFGPNVFRVETAAVFGLSVLTYELQG